MAIARILHVLHVLYILHVLHVLHVQRCRGTVTVAHVSQGDSSVFADDLPVTCR